MTEPILNGHPSHNIFACTWVQTRVLYISRLMHYTLSRTDRCFVLTKFWGVFTGKLLDFWTSINEALTGYSLIGVSARKCSV